MNRFAACLGMLLLATAPAVLAQDTGRRYQVEIVIFEQSPPTSELLVRPEAPAAGSEADVSEPVLTEPAPTPEPRTSLPEWLEGPAVSPEMEGVVRKLASGGYPVLWHQAWTQPANRLGSEQPVPLALLAAVGQGEARPGLSGEVTLSAGTYLHLGLDLEFLAGPGTTYELSQQRRVKIGEMHYFDHPRLGAIALVTLP
ncbi:MAG: CsiV family protein [Gammaproteobacteria bacterium]